MNLKLLRLGCNLSIGHDHVSTLQVEDRTLFTRVVSSLLSEKGQYAEEPYLIVGDGERQLPVKGALRILNTLPEMPSLDRGLQMKLSKKIRAQMEMSSADYLRLNDLISQVNAIIGEASGGLRGDYTLTKEWDIETYLKGFGFSVVSRDGYLLLDNCISYFGLCADLEPNTPVVLINAKSFFSTEELNELFDNAIFCGIQLVLLETWSDARIFGKERKQVIDQHFLFN